MNEKNGLSRPTYINGYYSRKLAKYLITHISWVYYVRSPRIRLGAHFNGSSENDCVYPKFPVKVVFVCRTKNVPVVRP